MEGAVAAASRISRTCPHSRACGGRRSLRGHHPLRGSRPGRGCDRGRADAADPEPRARSPAADRHRQSRSPACSRRVSWSCSRPTTHPGTTRERPRADARGVRAGGRPRLLSWRSRPSAWTPDAPTTRSAPRRRSSARSRPNRSRRRSSSTSSSATTSLTVSTPEAAELTKLLEYVFRSVNIALVNELAILCDRMGVDIWEVVDAAATKPYGFMSFKPGPGMGGHCLPVDPFYLAWRAREFDQPTEFIELAGEVNQRMPYFCVEKIGRALNNHSPPHQRARASPWWAWRTRPGWGTCASRPASRSSGSCATTAAMGLQRRLRARAGRLRPHLEPLDRAARRRRLRGDRDRPSGARRGSTSWPARPWSWTSAGSLAGSRLPTSCVFDGLAATLGPRLRVCFWARAWSCRTDVEREPRGARRHEVGPRPAPAGRAAWSASRSRSGRTPAPSREAPPPAEIGSGAARGHRRGDPGRRAGGRSAA